MKNSYLLKLSLFLSTVFLSSCTEKKPTVLNGYVEANYTRLSSVFGGRLEEIVVKSGDVINAKSKIFSLNNTAELAAVNEATARVQKSEVVLSDLETGAGENEISVIRGQLKEAQAIFKLAQINFNRQKKLLAEGLISQASFDLSKSQFEQASAKIESINAQLKVLKSPARIGQTQAQSAETTSAKEIYKQKLWAYSQKEVFAPKKPPEFIVENVYFQVGEFVPAGVPVVSLLAESEKFIRFFIPQEKLAQIKIGGQVNIICDGCESQYAKINFISTNAEFTPPILYNRENRAKLMFRVEALPEKPQNLKVGMPIDILLPK